MPKIKTKSSAKGRFKITGTGKILRTWAWKRHRLVNKSKDRKRSARGMAVLAHADMGRVRRFLRYVTG